MRSYFFPLAALLALMAAFPGRAATVFVRPYTSRPVYDGASWQTAFTTIQQGLDVAQPGDEVWVASGLYRETLTFRRARVSLYGGFQGTETVRGDRWGPTSVLSPANYWLPNITIPNWANEGMLDGFKLVGDGSERSAILCQATGVTVAQCSIENFRPAGAKGGAILCDTGSSITIRNNTIARNAALAGGIVAINATASIHDNIIYENTAAYSTGGQTDVTKDARGGGVAIFGGTADISDNTFGGNQALEGGGIFSMGANVSIRDNRFEDNSAAYSTGGNIDYTKDARGGAITITGGTADIRGNYITDSHARDGGGVWASDATVTFERNMLFRNRAEKEATTTPAAHVRSVGGGIALQDCTSVLKDNVFVSNQAYALAPPSTGNGAAAWGGAVAVLGGQATITNNTLADNIAIVSGVIWPPEYSRAMGGGIYASATSVIANNIFAGNEAIAPGGFGTPLYGAFYGGDLRKVQNNLFYHNIPDTSWLQPYGNLGNIWADPRFVPKGYWPSVNDYRLTAESPAIDRGDSAFVAPGETDWDGAPRIQGPRVDIGAFEVEAPPPPANVFVAPSGSDTNDGTSWAKAKSTVQAALLAVGPGGEVWVAAGTYRENLLVYGSAGLYGGFRGDETAREQRDPAVQITVLDGNENGPVLIIPSTTDGATVDGFTIRNGRETLGVPFAFGGGIRTAGRNVVIAHNIIEGNTVFREQRQPEARGGGIAVNGGSASVLNNVIRNNSSVALSTTSPLYTDPVSAFGAGVDVYQATATLANNLIVGNRARTNATKVNMIRGSVGGVSVWYADAMIVNNTIAGNTGDGLFVVGTSPVTVANTIIAFNTKGINVRTTPPLTLSHTCLFGNPDGDVIGTADPTGADGNIKADPQFIHAAEGDFRLQPFSPCRDAGNDAAAIGPTDVAGLPRLQGSHVDMGAHEWVMPTGAATVGDAASALRIAAGFNAPDPALFDRLNVDDPDARRIDLADAVRLVRRAAGLLAQ